MPFDIPHYRALYGFHVMKLRNLVLLQVMPDLIGTELRIHFRKSAGESPVPNFSPGSGERGLATAPQEQVELRGEIWVGPVGQPPVTGGSAHTGCTDPGQNIQLQMRQADIPQRAPSQTEMRSEQKQLRNH